MDTLVELVNLFNESDLNSFKEFLKHKNKRIDVKNIRLLNLIKNDDINNEKKLYKSSKNKDAYHALRKRLQDNLLLFLSQRTFETSSNEAYEVLRMVVVGRFLLENNLTKVAFKCLSKAEKLAGKLEQFNLIHEILLLKIQYAHVDVSESLAAMEERFLANQSNMQREVKLNLAYAYLRKELSAIHHGGKIVNLTALISNTVKRYKIAVVDFMNYKSLYQILFIANEYASIYQDYTLIEGYIRRSHRFIQNLNQHNESHAFYYLSILYYLANFNLRSRRFSESEVCLAQLFNLIENNKRYYQLFYLRYQLLVALNQYFQGESKLAIATLEKALKMKSVRICKQEDIEDLQICLAMFLAQYGDKRCLKELAKLNHTDAWYEKKMGMLWTIRKHLMEILIHIQFQNIDLALSRLSSFKRKYSQYLKSTHEDRVLFFLSLVEKYLLKPEIVFSATYQKTVFSMLEARENKDIFNLNFIAWIIALWDKRTSYEITLDLVNQVTDHIAD